MKHREQAVPDGHNHTPNKPWAPTALLHRARRPGTATAIDAAPEPGNGRRHLTPRAQRGGTAEHIMIRLDTEAA